jgi:hypothetical protein
MQTSHKPVRKCHACVLNLDDHCWLYTYPRLQWRDGKTCQAKEDEKIHREFETWQKQPQIKTREEIRREVFRSRSKKTCPRREPRRRISGGGYS